MKPKIWLELFKISSLSNVIEKCYGKQGAFIGCYVDDESRDLNQGPKDYGYDQKTCNIFFAFSVQLAEKNVLWTKNDTNP